MGILIRNNIVNQKGNPAWYEDTLAARPIANLQGRMFVDTNNPSTGIYRDTGSTWVNVADPGAGTTGTLQQVTTNGSSTNVGISVSANGIGIGTTIPGANILDIHGTTGVLAQLENTGSQNSLLSFRNQGAGVWSIGNGYNAGANDFIVYDAISFVNRLTIKSTGQTFIGSDTTSSGLFVVNSATSDNHIVVLGANGPSVRLRNSGTSPTLNVGLGISTGANNFIQGSVNGDFCIFNASTTASPILFGIYDNGSGNTLEAVRISAAKNFIIGSNVDSGYKFDVVGSGRFKAAQNALLYLEANGAFSPTIAFNTTNGANYIQSDYTTNSIKFLTNNASITALTLTTTGAATFYNSISIPSVVSNGFYKMLSSTLDAASREYRIFNDGYAYGDFVIDKATTQGGSTYVRQLILSGGNLTLGNVTGTGTGIIYASSATLSSATITGAITIGNTVTASVLNTVTNKVSIIIGGVQYYLLATTSAI